MRTSRMLKIDLVNRRWMVISRAYGILFIVLLGLVPLKHDFYPFVTKSDVCKTWELSQFNFPWSFAFPKGLSRESQIGCSSDARPLNQWAG